MPATHMPAVVHLLSSARGVYIPRDFATIVGEDHAVPGGTWTGLDMEDLQILSCGPDHEAYWDTWDSVLDQAVFTTPDGAKYHLFQDGDLFAVCRERMTLEEQRNLFCAEYAEDFVTPDGCRLYEINSYFVPALYHGDITGLSDQEAEQIAAFIAENGDSVVDTLPAYDEFGECEITGLHGRTSLVVLKEKSASV